MNIAVIGVLNPDEKIELTERMVTSEIIKHNATIVSGLALGCDSIAHKTALEKGAKTIAILPSTLDSILPKENGSRHAMEKAKSYGIKRGVIYNDSKHHDIAMYDLNRQILEEDSSVIRIDSANMSEAVLRLVTKTNQHFLF